jgi:D-glycero-D-manno-heptose 1,7-bisphosphate phosphatase
MTNKAIILDRDGVLIEDTAYPCEIDQILWKKGLRAAIKNWNDQGYLVFVASNQSGLARQYFGWDKLILLEEYMDDYLSEKHVEISEWVYCPHLGRDDFACSCRKPSPLMLNYLIEKYDLEIRDSWFIGDSERDIFAGQEAGLKTASIGKCQKSTLITPTQRLEELEDLYLA